jgi:hypothetical protein
VTLLDDDPDAVEAVLRPLYNFALEPSPPVCAETVKLYCNVVVAADKYDIHGLSEEARSGLVNLVAKMEPEEVVDSLKIIVHQYSDYELLKACVSKVINFRLKDLVTDAVTFRALQSVGRYRCSRCQRFLLGKVNGNVPMCCKTLPSAVGEGYVGKNL